MIHAFDTNILFDIFLPDPEFGPASREFLTGLGRENKCVVCDVVYAELAAVFPSRHVLDDALETLRVTFVPLHQDAAHAAGTAWKKYRAAGGSRVRVVADFLIGAHAMLQADSLCTRDRGFYQRYFPKLKVIEPE